MNNEGRSRMFTAGVAVAVLVCAMVAFLLSNARVEAAAQSLMDVQLQLLEDRAAVHQVPALRKQQIEIYNGLRGIAVGRATTSQLLLYFASISQRENVTIQDVQIQAAATPSPAPVQPSAQGQGSPPPALAPVVVPQEPTAPALIAQPIGFRLTGTYKDLLFALADLSCGPALIRVDTEPNVAVADNARVSMTVKGTLLTINDAVVPYVPPRSTGVRRGKAAGAARCVESSHV